MKTDESPMFTADSIQTDRGAAFLDAINQAVTFLQSSNQSEENVYQAFIQQMNHLKLIGLISTLDETKTSLVVRAAAYSAYDIKSFEHLTSLKILGFKFEVAKVDAFQRVIQTGQIEYFPESKDIITQIVPDTARFFLGGLLRNFGDMSAILIPLKIETNTKGVFTIVAPELKPRDMPVLQAFANHLSLALANARLIENIRHAETTYHSLFEASTDAIFLETLDGRILDCNTTACDMYGYTRDELLRLTVVDLVPIEVLPQLENIILQEMDNGGVFFETSNKHKNGNTFPVEVNTRLVTIEGRELVVVYVRDISQRKQVENHLRNTETALRQQAKELASLHAVTLKITAAQDLPQLLEMVVAQAVQLLDGFGGGFYLCDPEQELVRCAVSYRTKRDYTGTVLKFGEGVAGKVAQTGEPLIIDDYRKWEGRAEVYESDQPFQSVISTPVIWSGQVTGVLHVLDNELRHFTRENLELLTLFAHQAAIAIENARLLESERKRRQEAEILGQTTTALTSTLDLNEVLNNILNYLHEFLPYDSAAVFLLKNDSVRCQAAQGQPNPRAVIGQSFPADNPLFAEIRLTRRPLILQDAQSDPRFKKWGGTDYVRSWMGIPLIIQNQVIGFLTLDHRDLGSYRQKEATLAEVLANQAAIGIENARLFEAERNQLRLAQTLQKVGALLTSESSLKEVLENILDLLGQVVEYDTASIQLLDTDGRLYLAAGRGFPDMELSSRLVRELSDHMLKNQWAEHNVLLIPDTYADPRWVITPESEYIRSWVGAPLLVKGRFIGSLSVDNRTVNAYDDRVQETVSAFANQATIAIENARLFEAEHQRIAELQAVRAASLSLTTSLELSQVLNSILQAALDLLPEANNSHIFLFSPNDGGRLSFGAALWSEEYQRRPFSEPRPQGLTYTVARTGEMIVVPDMQHHPLYKNAPAEWQGAIVGLPLKIGNRVVGVMNISFHQSRRIPETEIRVLQMLGDQAAIAIENASLYEQAATERLHLGLLYDLNREITSSLEPDEILRRAAVLTCQSLGGIISEAYLYLPDENCLSLRTVYGQNFELAETPYTSMRLKLGEGLAGWVAYNRQAVRVNDITEDPRCIFIPGIDDNAKSAIVTPILAENQLLGVLSVLHGQSSAFTDEHLDLMGAISQEVGLALSNARRFQQVQRRLSESTLIQSLTQTFNRRLEVQALLDEVVEQLVDELDYDQITFFLIEENSLVLKASHGRPPMEAIYPLSRGIIGRVARTGQTAFVLDLSTDPDYYGHEGENYVSELAVPIFRNESVIGVVSIQCERNDLLTPQDRDLLQVLAGQISVALENAELYEQIRCYAEELEHTVDQRTAELTELYSLSQEIGFLLSYEEMLKLLLRHLHNAMQCDLVAGYLFADDHRFITVETNRPLSPSLIEKIRYQWLDPRNFNRETEYQGGDFDLEVITTKDYHDRHPQLDQINSRIQAPILVEGHTIGFLMAGYELEEAFGTQQEHLITTFANQAASAAARMSTILNAQQRQLESLVEHLPVGVLLLDPEFHILAANPLGREIAATLSRVNERGLDTIKRLGNYSVEDLIAHESPQLPVEIISDGSPRRIFSVQIRPAGSPVGDSRRHWVLTLNEITKERENLGRIQIQERLATVGQLAAGIAHDFNNIMAAILIYTDLLHYDPSIPPSSQEKVAIIQKQVERASSLIRQILDFSRKSVLTQSAIDLLPFVKEMDKMLARILPETIQLELVYHPDAYWVNGDPARLQQIFMNLALNARDAMPEGGKIQFKLNKFVLLPAETPPVLDMYPGHWVQITVTDTGCGIPDQVKDHIFEPFFTTKPVGQGTGLGLAQVYGIVKQHDGFIDIQSRVDEGTSFMIYLPALVVEEESPDDSSSPLKMDGKGKSVIVVEDDITTCQALQSLLEAHNYQVLTASNGVKALQILEKMHSDVNLVVSDIVMPEMGGLTLYRLLRDQYPETKILLITGHPLEEENQTLLEEGQADWIQKPFSVSQFTQIVKKLLEDE
jgi:PAS domain S-box-containing protein